MKIDNLERHIVSSLGLLTFVHKMKAKLCPPELMCQGQVRMQSGAQWADEQWSDAARQWGCTLERQGNEENRVKVWQTLYHQLHTDAHDAREPVDSAQVQRDPSDLHSQWLPTEDRRRGRSQRMVVQGQD
jgi:hypothetical protein